MQVAEHDRTHVLAMVVRVFAAIAIMAGSLAIFGWLCSSTFLTTPVPTEPPLKFNNALCFVLSGISLLILSRLKKGATWSDYLSTACVIIVLLIGSGTVLEHALHTNLGIDQLFIADATKRASGYAPGRMSVNAAIYLCLIGLSLLLVDCRPRLFRELRQWIAALVWLLTTAAVIGYGYGFTELYNYNDRNPLTFPSAVAFYGLAIAAFLLRPLEGPAAIYSSPTIAGASARTLGLAGVLLPGLALISGLNIRTSTDLFLVALLLFLGFPIAVWLAAQRLEKTEQKRLGEQKRSSQVIQALNDALEARVKELLETNAELESTRDAALDAVKVKSEFLGKISHELRTPLAGVVGMIQLIEVDELTTEDQEVLGLAEKSALHMLEIVNDLLNFSDLDSGKMQLRESDFSVADVVASVAAVIKPVAAKKDISVIEQIEPTLPVIKGDEDKLRKILLYLASNAVKFTNAGSILLRVKAGDQVNDLLHLQLSVSDTGIGISPEQRKKLFHPFSQADNSNTREYGGIALGLVITKNLVELMGGRFGFSSIQGKGSTFWCTIPFALAESQRSAGFQPALVPEQTPAPVHEQDNNGCKFLPVLDGVEVLVVEDNEMLQHGSEKQLESLGLKVQVVTHGQEAVAAATSRRYSAILIDCQLHVSDSVEVIRKIREVDQGRQRHTPVIAMMAADQSEELASLKDTDMDDVLVKPVSTELLAEKMAALCISKNGA